MNDVLFNFFNSQLLWNARLVQQMLPIGHIVMERMQALFLVAIWGSMERIQVLRLLSAVSTRSSFDTFQRYLSLYVRKSERGCKLAWDIGSVSSCDMNTNENNNTTNIIAENMSEPSSELNRENPKFRGNFHWIKWLGKKLWYSEPHAWNAFNTKSQHCTLLFF